MKKNNGGYMIIVAILILTILGIIVPAFIRYIQKDSKDSVGQAKKTKAFQLAEMGQDRGAWKLRESDAIWNTAAAGTTISNYNDDTEFSDAGGKYKINFNPGPGPSDVTVISKGRADNSTEMRAISAVYSKAAVTGALSVVGGLNWRSNLNVEWGPVVEYGSITSAPSTTYPRKFAAGSIAGYDIDPNPPNGAEPGDNWTTYDYASYYNLGTAPTIDLDSYRTLADNSCVPEMSKTTSNSAANHGTGPGGCTNGHYTEGVKIDPPGGGGTDYSFVCDTCVIFIEGNVASFPNHAWLDVRALVVTGTTDFNAKNTVYRATIPAGCQQEYLFPAAATYWASKGWNDNGTTVVNISNVGMHGFLYSGGDIANSGGNSIIVGGIYVLGNLTVNTTTVYYDSEISNNVLLTNATVTRSNWDEILTSW